MAPPEIAGYKIEKTLGTGGFASVYLATQDSDGERVAIKVLHAHTSNASDLRRFEREANTCLLYTSPSPRDQRGSRMPSSA